MSEFELLVSAWSALANLLLAGAAIAAAIAAFLGLNAWKHQGIWSSDSELARKVLIAAYRYRDSLYSVRHPAVQNSEMLISEEDSKGLSSSEISRRGTIQAYTRRWERHQPFTNELNALLVEADAVWGNRLSTLVADAKSLERELYSYIWLHLNAHFRGDTDLAAEYKKILKSKRDILYDNLEDSDVFRKDFVQKLEPIESYLRSKLGRS